MPGSEPREQKRAGKNGCVKRKSSEKVPPAAPDDARKLLASPVRGPGVTIWVDADACPKVIRDILFRAAERTGVALVLVANRLLPTPPRANIRALAVAPGFDVADNEIVARVAAGDLVITADIPLAYEVIEKGATALNPRGELYTSANVKARLVMRDLMDQLRGSGIHSGGPPPLSESEKRQFANHLDRYLARSRP